MGWDQSGVDPIVIAHIPRCNVSFLPVERFLTKVVQGDTDRGVTSLVALGW